MENGSLASTLVFFVLASVMVVCSILAVTTKKILRAATYLLFVLFATACPPITLPTSLTTT